MRPVASPHLVAALLLSCSQTSVPSHTHNTAPSAAPERDTNAPLAPVTEAFDYGTRPDGTDAQFFTLVCRSPALRATRTD